ncbi:MAG: hypothetical protein ACI8WT_002130 [Clostridium sp.]|jgi:hypothetical protein
MDELIKADTDSEISTQNNDSDVAVFGKVLRINKLSADIDFEGMLDKVLQYVNINEIIHNVKKGAEYVVQVPSEFQAGLDSGDYNMMENLKTGKMWPSLMKIGEDGRNKIVTPLSIKKQEFIQGNPFQEMTMGYHNLCMQKQINELSQLMERTLNIVKRIEQGQKGDRIGLLSSGKDQILLALSQKDEGSRNLALQLGRKSVFDSRGQLAEILKQRITDYEVVSKSSVVRFLREFASNGYLQGKDDEYQEIQEYFDLYLQATKMIVDSYAVVGDNENAERVFNISIEYMESIDFSKLKTIEFAHKYCKFEGIYDYSAEYLTTEKQACLEEAKQYDCLSIEVSGEKLLEVIANGKTEEIPE